MLVCLLAALLSIEVLINCLLLPYPVALNDMVDNSFSHHLLSKKSKLTTYQKAPQFWSKSCRNSTLKQVLRSPISIYNLIYLSARLGVRTWFLNSQSNDLSRTLRNRQFIYYVAHLHLIFLQLCHTLLYKLILF